MPFNVSRLGPARLFGISALLSWASIAGTAEQSAQACARLVDRDQRLDCYDAVFRAPPGQDFGLTPQQVERASSADGAGAPKVDSITAKITALTRARTGRLTIELDNGQTWTQSESDSRAMLRVGDGVTIRRAAMGSYMLIAPTGTGIRVRRME